MSLGRYQIGIGLPAFVKAIFPNDPGSFDIDNRFRIYPKIHLRHAFGFELNTQKTGFINIGGKLGFDFTFHSNKKWNFYCGPDFSYKYSKIKNINRDYISFGTGFLIGIQYILSKNFSISSEPVIFFRRNQMIDNASFSLEKSSVWYESGIGKLGYLQLNFHF